MPVSRDQRRHLVSAGLALAALAGLAGCKEQKSGAGAAGAADTARQAAEQNIRAGAPAAQMTFRGEQVYAQAIPQRVAVCGQVDPFPDDSKMFVPFVSIVTNTAEATAAPQFTFEKYIGVTTAEAGRVYLAMVNYCYDKGGPGNGPVHSVMPMAPLPDSIPDPAVHNVPPPAVASAAATPPVPPAGTTAGTPASGSVTMRQAANVRGAFRVAGAPALGTAILLDDRRSSGWTLAMAGGQLLLAGAERVVPLVLGTLQ